MSKATKTRPHFHAKDGIDCDELISHCTAFKDNGSIYIEPESLVVDITDCEMIYREEHTYINVRNGPPEHPISFTRAELWTEDGRDYARYEVTL